MSRFDRIIVATVLGLAVVIGGLSFESIRLGPSVDKLATAHTFDGTPVNTQIAVTFTAKMDRQSVQTAFHLTPQVRETSPGPRANSSSDHAHPSPTVPRTPSASARRLMTRPVSLSHTRIPRIS